MQGTIKNNNILKLNDYFQNIQFVYISIPENILFIPEKYLLETSDHGIDLSV